MGSEEQKGLGKTPMCLMEEDKPYKNSRVYHIEQSFSRSEVMGVPGYLFKMKDKLLCCATSNMKKKYS